MRFTMILEGHRDIIGNLHRLESTMTRTGATSAWNGAQHLFARTRAVVPYMSGDLYNAAYMSNIGEKKFPMWVVGYLPLGYEVAVHEIPNRVHPTRGPSSEPKQDHFLSEPRDQMVKTFPRTVADDLEAAIRRTPFHRSISRRGR